MQNICVGKNHAKIFHYNNEILIRHVNDRIKLYEKENILYIKNIMKHNLINKFAPFHAYEGSQEAELVDKLIVANGNIINKYKGDAFTNPQLNALLTEKNIDQLELAGVDGGGCVALTAFGAIKAGYKVSICMNAVGTVFEKNAKKYRIELEKLGTVFQDFNN